MMLNEQVRLEPSKRGGVNAGYRSLMEPLMVVSKSIVIEE